MSLFRGKRIYELYRHQTFGQSNKPPAAHQKASNKVAKWIASVPSTGLFVLHNMRLSDSDNVSFFYHSSSLNLKYYYATIIC